jgi:hypothetical protein
MIARTMTIRPGPRPRDRLIPLPRAETGEPSEGREMNRGVLRKATGMGPPGWSVSVRAGPHCRGSGRLLGIGPPVRFSRPRESISVAGTDPPELNLSAIEDRRSCDCPAMSRAGPRCRSDGLGSRPRGHPGRGDGSDGPLSCQMLRRGARILGELRAGGNGPPLWAARTVAADGLSGCDPPRGHHNGREEIAAARDDPPWRDELDPVRLESRGLVTILGVRALRRKRRDSSSGKSPPRGFVRARASIAVGQVGTKPRKGKIQGRGSIGHPQRIGPPVRFSRARESIAWVVEVFLLWRRVRDKNVRY